MNRRPLYLRRFLFAAAVVLTVSLQFSFGKFISIGSAAPLLALPLVIAIAMNENSLWAVLFGAFAGVLSDMLSISKDGFFGVSFSIAAFATASLVIFRFRRTFAAALIFSAFWSLAINAAYWFFFLVLKGYDMLFTLLFEKHIASALYTTAFIILFYPVINGICAATRGREEEREN